MKCPRCQHENRPGAKFCEECAAPLARACMNCGAQLSATAKFCSECAYPAGPAAGPTPLRFGTPETYTPKHLAERIINSKASLEGERKQVTVLFADLKGSMELLADRDPEEARKILDPVLELMMEAVHRYEGTVNQVMGDGIMALFGAPIAHEDHAPRACYAALRMQERVTAHAEKIQSSTGASVQIRVGLNSGDVVVRSIGSDLRMDYTAVGETTHLAARMEQMAAPGSILLGPQTVRLTDGYVTLGPLGAFPVKGLSEPIEVHELLGVAPLRSRLHQAAARGFASFVGREHEVAQLERALTRARGGQGQIVATLGEAGVGKSRLYWEFTRSPVVIGVRVLEGRSISYGKASSYLPIVDLLQAYFQIDARDAPDTVRAKVTAGLHALDSGLRVTLTPVLGLLDVPVQDQAWDALDPLQRKARTSDAIKRIVLREARNQPVVLVFEDLHWIDAETQAVFDLLVDSVPDASILMLVNYRPDYEHRWGAKRNYTQITLDPLISASARMLLDNMLGGDATVAPLKQALIDRMQGNPFFIEETVRMLTETGAVAQTDGVYRLARHVTDLQVPPTVQAVLAGRMDRLAPEEKRLLQSAAAVGVHVPVVLLRSVAELPDGQVHQALERLRGGGFLYERSAFPEPEYAFKHALTHEVAYATLLSERRRALHARILEAIETEYAGRLGEHAERLARHAFVGQVWDKAVTYLRQASAKVGARAAYAEAGQYLEQALEAVARLPDDRDKIEQSIDVHLHLRHNRVVLGETARGYEHLVVAEREARRVGDHLRLGFVLTSICHHHWMVGNPVVARRFGQEAVTLAERMGDKALQVYTQFIWGFACSMWGDSGPAKLALQRVVDLVGEDYFPTRGISAYPGSAAHAVLSSTLGLLRGEFDEGARHGAEAMRIAEAVDHPFSLAYALLHLTWLEITRGNFARAVALGTRGVGLCREGPIPFLLSSLLALAGYALAASGRLDEGVPMVREALARQEAMKYRSTLSWIVAANAAIHMLTGRRGEALEQAGRALAVARECGEAFNEARALLLLGEVHDAGGDADAASRVYVEALELARDRGMRPLVAHCHLGLGKLYRRTNKREQAQEHLATATTMYREMGMTYWLEKAEAEEPGR